MSVGRVFGSVAMRAETHPRSPRHAKHEEMDGEGGQEEVGN